jgi:hypothetical protein
MTTSTAPANTSDRLARPPVFEAWGRLIYRRRKLILMIATLFAVAGAVWGNHHLRVSADRRRVHRPYTLATTPNLARPPRSATIDSLATGLEVPVSAVRAAAAKSTARHYYDQAPAQPQHHPADRDRDLLIAGLDELTPDGRRHVAALVQSLRNETRTS